MSAKSNGMQQPWRDPDDAPELTDAFFEQATPMVGGRIVSKQEFSKAAAKAMRSGRPRLAQSKQALTVRYDADIIAAFKATGDGWQTRMNDALREWLNTQPFTPPPSN